MRLLVDSLMSGISQNNRRRDNMTYKEWKAGKQNSGISSKGVATRQDIVNKAIKTIPSSIDRKLISNLIAKVDSDNVLHLEFDSYIDADNKSDPRAKAEILRAREAAYELGAHFDNAFAAGLPTVEYGEDNYMPYIELSPTIISDTTSTIVERITPYKFRYNKGKSNMTYAQWKANKVDIPTIKKEIVEVAWSIKDEMDKVIDSLDSSEVLSIALEKAGVLAEATADEYDRKIDPFVRQMGQRKYRDNEFIKAGKLNSQNTQWKANKTSKNVDNLIIVEYLQKNLPFNYETIDSNDLEFDVNVAVEVTLTARGNIKAVFKATAPKRPYQEELLFAIDDRVETILSRAEDEFGIELNFDTLSGGKTIIITIAPQTQNNNKGKSNMTYAQWKATKNRTAAFESAVTRIAKAAAKELNGSFGDDMAEDGTGLSEAINEAIEWVSDEYEAIVDKAIAAEEAAGEPNALNRFMEQLEETIARLVKPGRFAVDNRSNKNRKTNITYKEWKANKARRKNDAFTPIEPTTTEPEIIPTVTIEEFDALLARVTIIEEVLGIGTEEPTIPTFEVTDEFITEVANKLAKLYPSATNTAKKTIPASPRVPAAPIPKANEDDDTIPPPIGFFK